LNAAYVAGGLGMVCGLLLVVVIVQFLAHGGGSRPADKKAIEEPLPDPSPRLIRFAPPQPPSPVPAPDSSPSLAWLEDATVFLKLKIGKAFGSGTGFAIRMQGDTALIATNRHVVTPDLDDEAGAKLEVTAVFRSGKGPGQEESLPAEIVAIDSGEEINHDLALLRVRGLKLPVKPIDVNRTAGPTLRMRYAAYGFPLPMIKFNQGNPTITVTGGQVSTLRNDDMGQLFAIQLDGSLQPGNSGGPIVDDRGRLIGVAVAKLEGVDTIGLAIPADELRDLLAGRVGAIDLDVRNSKSPQPDLRVRAQVVDPNGRIKGVKVLVAPAHGTARLARRGDGSWPPMPGASPVDLKLDHSVATGEVKVALGKTGADARRVLIQTAHLDSTGKLLHSRPRPYDLGDQDGKIVGRRKIEELRRKLARQSLRRLGPLVEDDDPKTADECRLAKDEKERKSSIALPPKLFSLSPKIVKQRKPLHNAPRTMAEVEGDFLAYVKVDGDIDPGLDPPADPRGRRLPITFQGAGLLLYQDKENFVRLERACTAVGASLIRELLVEVVRGGQEIDYYYIALPGDPSAPLDLFLIRRKGRVQCLFSHDGRSLLGFREFSLDYPAKVKIGLTASNLSRKPFTARFSDFFLLNDKLKLAEEFGD
jgi:S1-C subfamily serine protease/regulation of enolase protein 1 (concanavalin A-like superfamily)